MVIRMMSTATEYKCPRCGRRLTNNKILNLGQITEVHMIKGLIDCTSCKIIVTLEDMRNSVKQSWFG